MAETYNVYFDDGSGMILVAAELDIPELTITFGPFDYATDYSWRVDATNGAGTTEGDTWTFKSLEFNPPLPIGVTMVDGKPASGTTGTPTGKNNMMTTKRLMAAAQNKIWYEAI